MVKIEQSNGTISITNEVFTNLAGDAATSCFGVKGMVGRSKDSGPFQLLRRDAENISALAPRILHDDSYPLQQATGVPVACVAVYVDTMFLD